MCIDVVTNHAVDGQHISRPCYTCSQCRKECCDSQVPQLWGLPVRCVGCRGSNEQRKLDLPQLNCHVQEAQKAKAKVVNTLQPKLRPR